ncbi:MAG: nucleotidyltransferase family protein [Anaerolineales bacterium]|nr:nucleotidyltransferase family protein [Anaerolineales bacterium]
MIEAERAAAREHVVALIQRQALLLRALGVRRLGLFGSFVRGEQTNSSDVDVLVEFEAGQKTFDHFMQLAALLEGALGREVDLVTPESLSPYLRPFILQEIEYVALDD